MKQHVGIVRLAIGVTLAFCGLSGRTTTAKAAEPVPAGPATLRPTVQIETTLGDIVVALDAEHAPTTVLNFLDYAADGFYEGTVFHRVVPGRVVQGGGYTADMTGKKTGLRPPIADESYNGLKNDRWTIAMFRAPGDFKSARTQFFINVVDNSSFDRLRDGSGYTVFGRVVDGIATVERIRDARVGTHPKYAAGKNPVVPVDPVVVRSIRLLTPFDRTEAVALAESAVELRRNRVNILVKRLENEAGTKAMTTESGLRYVDFRVGKGAFPLVEEAVEVNYRGTLVDGREFDSSARQTEGPLTVNMDSAIKGLREGLQSMREGGKRTLVVPPELAYGADGIPGRVPPNSTLIYEIELLAVKPPVKKRDIEPALGDEP
jgi:peptidyl-prolyl cis-trans isomerase A (cyclophilin A)